jgi:hypothetical protein
MLKLKEKDTNLFYLASGFANEEPVYYTFQQIAANVGPGWSDILEDLCVKLLHLGWNGGYEQIKEKFGTLRFYWINNLSGIKGDIAYDCVEVAEWRSGMYCEMCGNLARQREGGWVLTLCPECAVKRGYPINKYEKEELLLKGKITPETEVVLRPENA